MLVTFYGYGEGKSGLSEEKCVVTQPAIGAISISIKKLGLIRLRISVFSALLLTHIRIISYYTNKKEQGKH